MQELHEPTFNELLRIYADAAVKERIRNGKPSVESVKNVLRAIKRILRECHLARTRKVSALTRERLDSFLVEKINDGLSAISAKSYMDQLRAIIPRWATVYYREKGISVKPFELPLVHVPVKRYVRPDKVLLGKVKDWYSSLSERDGKEYWIAATLMLEFGMRNGDIKQLSWHNFSEKDEGVFLHYTPHKTALSSGRFVCWPVHPDIWTAFCAYRDHHACSKKDECANIELVLPAAGEWLRKINRELRELGFAGGKAAYELRKICIDHVYQKFGAEMASSISGDDIRTVTRYYADPSAVSVEGVRVVDLL